MREQPRHVRLERFDARNEARSNNRIGERMIVGRRGRCRRIYLCVSPKTFILFFGGVGWCFFPPLPFAPALRFNASLPCAALILVLIAVLAFARHVGMLPVVVDVSSPASSAASLPPPSASATSR